MPSTVDGSASDCATDEESGGERELRGDRWRSWELGARSGEMGGDQGSSEGGPTCAIEIRGRWVEIGGAQREVLPAPSTRSHDVCNQVQSSAITCAIDEKS